MPIMNGYDACKKIRKIYSKMNYFTIIACTADATLENKTKCKKLGFSNIVYKPFRKSELEKLITKYFH